MMENKIFEMLDAALKNQQEIYNKEAHIENQNAEIIWAQVFHDTIKGSEWLPVDFPLSPGRAALGYPALYVLYRVLNEFRPQKILEMGLGQSTKVISQYTKYMISKEKDYVHNIVEHDKSWIDFFENHFQLPICTKIINLPMVDKMISLNNSPMSNVTVYEGFDETFKGQKFDFVMIDGPIGVRSINYSRIDILGILPDCLEKSFVVFLDDCQRQGEKNTLELIANTLADHGISAYYNIYRGEKGTGIVVSEDLKYMCTL